MLEAMKAQCLSDYPSHLRVAQCALYCTAKRIELVFGTKAYGYLRLPYAVIKSNQQLI